jgi:hypothetical protein
LAQPPYGVGDDEADAVLTSGGGTIVTAVVLSFPTGAPPEQAHCNRSSTGDNSKSIALIIRFIFSRLLQKVSPDPFASSDF